MNKKIEYIWLSKLELSNKFKLKLIKELGGIEGLYRASLDDLVYLNLQDIYISKILDINLKNEAKKDFEYINKKNIDIISIENANYPSKLKNISNFPICFYVMRK